MNEPSCSHVTVSPIRNKWGKITKWASTAWDDQGNIYWWNRHQTLTVAQREAAAKARQLGVQWLETDQLDYDLDLETGLKSLAAQKGYRLGKMPPDEAEKQAKLGHGPYYLDIISTGMCAMYGLRLDELEFKIYQLEERV